MVLMMKHHFIVAGEFLFFLARQFPRELSLKPELLLLVSLSRLGGAWTSTVLVKS